MEERSGNKGAKGLDEGVDIDRLRDPKDLVEHKGGRVVPMEYGELVVYPGEGNSVLMFQYRYFNKGVEGVAIERMMDGSYNHRSYNVDLDTGAIWAGGRILRRSGNLDVGQLIKYRE